MAYSSLAETYGFNANTAVFASGTYTDSANAPCNLIVSSANGGSIYIKDATGAVVFQQPSRPPPYAFKGIAFGTCGSSGRLGPSASACIASYALYGAWTSDSAFFRVDNGIQAWTVPSTSQYSFTVAGASGGTLGGLAAVVSGSVTLEAGSTVYLVVGQLPQAQNTSVSSGGGGASYVFLGNLDTPLLVAGELT